MSKNNAEYQLVIVGAGAAGLGASQQAGQAGIDHIVLEASHRIGGRGLTEYLEGSIPVDLGCHWLHSASSNPYREWADRFGFHYNRGKYEYRILYDGEWLGQEAMVESEKFIADCYTRFDELYEQDPGTCALEGVDVDSRWTPYFFYWMSLMHSNDIDQVSVQDYAEYFDTNEDWPLREGYGALIAKQGQDCPVRLNTEVSAINWENAPVRITTNRGTVTAQKVIIAVSTGVLGADCIAFNPALPVAKREAIHGLPMGNYNYQFFSIEPDALREDAGSIHYCKGDLCLNVRIRQFDFPCVFTCTAGRHAWWLERQGTEASRAFFLEVLVDIFGGDVTRILREFKVSAWGYDPWIRGAYSSQLPGKSGLRSVLAQPVDETLYFAGEATSMDALNTAHGAYRSGQRAVREAVRELL